MSVADWLGVMADKCGDHGPSCLKVQRDYIDNNECTDQEGIVEDQDPPLDDDNIKVPVGSRVKLVIWCPPDESTDEDEGESNESTNGSGTDQTSESATTGQSDE